MKRVVLALVSTVTGLVMLLGFKTHSTAAPVALGSTGTSSTGTGSTGSTGGATSAGPSAPGTTTSKIRTVNGHAAHTPYGPVQVQVQLSGSKITNVQVLQHPTASGQDQQINGYALPILINETMTVQSAHIDSVSGATYTSDGYIRSLQGALDQAGITR